MKHLYLPIGREGYQITADVAQAALASGEISICEQCSTGTTVAYH